MGARISTSRSGTNKQDYTTPDELMRAVESLFGPLAFDLAATATNKRCPRYFAPSTGPLGPMPFDLNSFGMDAFDHSWTELSRRFRRPDGTPGLLWLNCEFAHIEDWAERSRNEGILGANILLLTPAATGAIWFDELVAAYADIYFLKPRIPFIAGEPYNKDCMLSHFGPPTATRPDNGKGGRATIESRRCIHVFDWKTGKISHVWERWVVRP